MVRPARPDETPQFGQAWAWDDENDPLMCIGPVSETRDRWLFIDLGADANIQAWYWCDEAGRTYPDWLLLDE